MLNKRSYLTEKIYWKGVDFCYDALSILLWANEAQFSCAHSLHSKYELKSARLLSELLFICVVWSQQFTTSSQGQKGVNKSRREKSKQRPTDRMTNRPINQTTNWPNDRQTKRPTNRLTYSHFLSCFPLYNLHFAFVLTHPRVKSMPTADSGVCLT